jgi:glutathione S-transferase
VDKEPIIAQSGAIYRRVGNDLGLGGSTPQARAIADMIVCSQADVQMALRPLFEAAEVDKPKAKEVAKEKVKAVVTALEKLLIAGGGQWFAGEVGA